MRRATRPPVRTWAPSDKRNKSFSSVSLDPAKKAAAAAAFLLQASWNDDRWDRRYDSGFWPADVAAGVVGGIIREPRVPCARAAAPVG